MRTVDVVFIAIISLTIFAVIIIWNEVQRSKQQTSAVGSALSYAMDLLNRGIVDDNIEKYTRPLRKPSFIHLMESFRAHEVKTHM